MGCSSLPPRGPCPWNSGSNLVADSDAEQLKAARGLDRILISFDEFRGKDGAEVAAKLQLNGGRIVQLSRGPQQRIYRSFAKLLSHFDEWMDFLQAQRGVVVLHDLRQKPTFYTVEEYGKRKVTTSSRHFFDEYIAYWKNRQLAELTPRPTLTPEERLLMNPLPEPSNGETGLS